MNAIEEQILANQIAIMRAILLPAYKGELDARISESLDLIREGSTGVVPA